MINRDHELPVTRQAEALAISKGSIPGIVWAHL